MNEKTLAARLQDPDRGLCSLLCTPPSRMELPEPGLRIEFPWLLFSSSERSNLLTSWLSAFCFLQGAFFMFNFFFKASHFYSQCLLAAFDRAKSRRRIQRLPILSFAFRGQGVTRASWLMPSNLAVKLKEGKKKKQRRNPWKETVYSVWLGCEVRRCLWAGG